MKQFTIKSLKCIFILVFLVALPNLALLADNWNTGSGGNSSRNCRTSESGPVTADLLWENGVNAVISQQPVIDGDIVVMSRIVSISNIPGSSVIVAQSLVTGDTLWTKKLPLDFPATDWGSRVSAFRNGVVYATRSGNSNSSFMYALDVLTGEIIWKSQGLISESSTESCAFASNGDLIVGNFNSIIRINALDGSTVWETPRVCPTSNGQEISVYGEKGYYWEANFYGPVVRVINLETGQHLYSSESLSAGYIQQLCLMIGPDGTIYAPRSMNNGSTDYMVALRDNGSSFTELWRTPVGFIPMSTSGVGPDGSIYTYNNAGEVIRLDPQDGSIMNTSVSIFTSIGSR
jgi:outer membrane protein assembly factor BamB